MKKFPKNSLSFICSLLIIYAVLTVFFFMIITNFYSFDVIKNIEQKVVYEKDYSQFFQMIPFVVIALLLAWMLHKKIFFGYQLSVILSGVYIPVTLFNIYFNFSILSAMTGMAYRSTLLLILYLFIAFMFSIVIFVLLIRTETRSIFYSHSRQ